MVYPAYYATLEYHRAPPGRILMVLPCTGAGAPRSRLQRLLHAPRAGCCDFARIVSSSGILKNPVLIIKAPNVEPYYRSLLEPLKGTLF